MLVFDGLGTMIFFGVWIFCFVDTLLTPEVLVRNLPKVVWVLLVLIFNIFGSIAWLIAGRPWYRAPVGAPRRAASRNADYRAANYRPPSPDDDEEFLAGLRKRVDEQRRRAREQSEREPGDDPSA